jgi:hypothetical protein
MANKRKSAVGRTVLSPASPSNRSRVSNGRAILPFTDGRSAEARRYRDLCAAIVNDRGGLSKCSESLLSLIRRFAAQSVLAEQLEARIARGETMDNAAVAVHSQLSSTLVRLSNKIGIGRSMKTVPSLDEYLAGQATGDTDE